ncbi:unnamed protein product, partial [Discosporangium mesarthrocarpum]
DPEDSIRTNAIIFLGKVAGHLRADVRDKVVLPAFAKGVRDSFPAARLAGLRATAACHQHVQPEEVCTKVLPFVMPCLIDPSSKAVREAAFACFGVYVEKLKAVSQRMAQEEEEIRQKEAEGHTADLAQGHGSTGSLCSDGASSRGGGGAGVGGLAPGVGQQKKSLDWSRLGEWAG